MKIDDILNSLEYNICGQPLINFPIECVANWIQGGNGIYGIICLENNKVLVGEGKIGFQNGNRLTRHIGPVNNIENAVYKLDRKKYNIDKFKLLFFKYENSPIKRLEIEAELQKYFIEQNLCYNIVQLKNMGKNKTRGVSKYYGVSLKRGVWQATLAVCNTQKDTMKYHLGYYNNETDAAQIYDYYVFHRRLKKPINFPDIDYESFIPHKCRNGNRNKYIQEILDNKNAVLTA